MKVLEGTSYQFVCFGFAEEIARMDEMYHHQHTSSTSHHKIERTSIRTYYSNLDLSQQSSCSSRHAYRQQASQPAQVPMQAQLLGRQQQDYGQRNANYMNQLERYMDDLEVGGEAADVDLDADFEDDEMLYRRQRRGSYAPGMQQPMGRYVELVPTSLQTAKGRMQHPGQGQGQGVQRLRSPSLPAIRQRHKAAAGPPNQPQLGNNAKGAIKMDPGNAAHRLNNNNINGSNGGNPSGNQAQPIAGCQEEDTSGYLSDTPKNTHTPDIWYNDAASQNGSISGAGGSASQADESVVSAATASNAGGGGLRRLRRSIPCAPLSQPVAMPGPTPSLPPSTGPPPPAGKCNQALNQAYVIKGRRVPGQGHSYEPLAADGYLADR